MAHVPKKPIDSDFNNGIPYTSGDFMFSDYEAETLASSALWTADKIDKLTGPIDNTNANKIGEAKIEIGPNGNLIASNLKGESFAIKHFYKSVDTMLKDLMNNQDKFAIYDLAIIQSDNGAKDEDNAKMYQCIYEGDTTRKLLIFVSDLSGVTGATGCSIRSTYSELIHSSTELPFDDIINSENIQIGDIIFSNHDYSNGVYGNVRTVVSNQNHKYVVINLIGKIGNTATQWGSTPLEIPKIGIEDTFIPIQHIYMKGTFPVNTGDLILSNHSASMGAYGAVRHSPTIVDDIEGVYVDYRGSLIGPTGYSFFRYANSTRYVKGMRIYSSSLVRSDRFPVVGDWAVFASGDLVRLKTYSAGIDDGGAHFFGDDNGIIKIKGAGLYYSTALTSSFTTRILIDTVSPTGCGIGDHVFGRTGTVHYIESIESQYFNIVETSISLQGMQGIPGRDGPIGLTPNITPEAIGLPEGSIPTVTRSGTNARPFLTFGIPKGEKGNTGDPFTISKIYANIDAMNSGYASDNVPIGGFIVIDTGNVEDEDNGKLYIKGEIEYTYLVDLSGIQGFTGVGIASIVLDSQLEDGSNKYKVILTNNEFSYFTAPIGHTGSVGKAAIVTVGSTTTLPVGSNATVENVGTPDNAIFNFGIPKGEKGEHGGEVLSLDNTFTGTNNFTKTATFNVAAIAPGIIVKDNGATPGINVTSDASPGTFVQLTSNKISMREPTGLTSSITPTHNGLVISGLTGSPPDVTCATSKLYVQEELTKKAGLTANNTFTGGNTFDGTGSTVRFNYLNDYKVPRLYMGGGSIVMDSDASGSGGDIDMFGGDIRMHGDREYPGINSGGTIYMSQGRLVDANYISASNVTLGTPDTVTALTVYSQDSDLSTTAVKIQGNNITLNSQVGDLTLGAINGGPRFGLSLLSSSENTIKCVTGLNPPLLSGDAANKAYVDSKTKYQHNIIMYQNSGSNQSRIAFSFLSTSSKSITSMDELWTAMSKFSFVAIPASGLVAIIPPTFLVSVSTVKANSATGYISVMGFVISTGAQHDSSLGPQSISLVTDNVL